MSRKIACLTLDVEGDFKDPEGRIRLFEDEGLLRRYVALVEEHDVKVTAFLVTSLLDRYADDFRRLSELIPVEFESHSHAHDLENPCSRVDIEASVSAFHAFAGRDPAGYRAPVGLITQEGLDTLFDLGFQYDSSIYPSLRPGTLGHNNLHLPVSPFRIRRGADAIVEVPFGTVSRVRLDFSLSYVKMLGWKPYELIMKAFPLPDQVAVLSHPYDHYFHVLPYEIRDWMAPMLRRNARSAFDLLGTMLRFLRGQGYEFAFMSDLCDHLATQRLRELPVEKVVR